MSIIAAVALVLAAFILIQKPAEASPTVSVAAVVAGAASVGSAAPQLGNFICGLLQSIFSAFLNSPFFAFLGTFFSDILDSFGCGDISGT